MKTFNRLLGFLRPYKSGVIASCALASAAMVMTVALPYLSGEAVNSIQSGFKHASDHQGAARAEDLQTLKMLALAILAVVLVRWGLTYLRRIIAGRVSLGIEYDLRERMYSHLQRLELGFFDRQQTGQLMSRVTVDLQAVRFFLGYGLVFILQSALTLVLAGIAMIIINPALGLIAMAPVPFVVFISQRYGRAARPAIQEVQQRIAELTANAEENISGVRVVKSFAREPLQLRRFQGSVDRVFDQAMVATRLEARYNPMIGFLPQLGLGAVLLIGGHAVIHAQLSLGQFTAFYFYLNMLIAPMRSLGVTLGLAQRATASGARIFQVLDREPRMESLPGAPGLPPGSGHVELRGVTLRYDGTDDFGAGWSEDGRESVQRTARAVLQRHRPRRAGRADHRPRRRHRLGQDQPGVADTAPVRRQRGGGADRRSGRAGGRYRIAAALDRSRQRRPVPVLGLDRPEHRLRPASGHAGAGRESPPAAPRRTSSSLGCPRAMRHRSASAASPCRAASASALPSRGRSSPTRGC